MRKPRIPGVTHLKHDPDNCLVCSAATKSHHRRPVEMVPPPRHRAAGTGRSGDYSGRHRVYEGRHRGK